MARVEKVWMNGGEAPSSFSAPAASSKKKAKKKRQRSSDDEDEYDFYVATKPRPSSSRSRASSSAIQAPTVTTTQIALKSEIAPFVALESPSEPKAALNVLPTPAVRPISRASTTASPKAKDGKNRLIVETVRIFVYFLNHQG